MSEVSIGVDIGGTKIHFASVDRRGGIVCQHIEPTPAKQGAEKMMDTVLNGIGRIIQLTQELPEPRQIKGIGIGSAGQINFHTGTVEGAVDTIVNWAGTPIKQIVESGYRYPVFVDNDVNVIALAEKYFGAGLQYRHYICVALGTGIGGAIVESDQMLRGAFGAAGEIGHISVDFNGPLCSCGNYGCLELYASGTGIARVAAEMVEKHQWNVPWKINSFEIIAAWKEGDEYAGQVMDTVIRALGTGISGLIHTFNPEAVIIGGGVSEAGEFFFNSLIRETERRTSPAMWRAVKLLPAVVGSHSGVIGAAVQVWHYS